MEQVKRDVYTIAYPSMNWHPGRHLTIRIKHEEWVLRGDAPIEVEQDAVGAPPASDEPQR